VEPDLVLDRSLPTTANAINDGQRIVIVTVLTAFAFGFFFRSRMAAFIAYIAVFAWSCTFESVYLMLAAVDRQTDAAQNTLSS